MNTAKDAAADLGQLLAATALRDQKAFAELYRLTSPKLFAVALRILRRRDWAEDVLQEAYVNIWHHAQTYNLLHSAPMTWLTTIVRNRCLDWLRRGGREERESDGDAALEGLETAEPGPLDRLLGKSEAQNLANCLGGLAAKERQSIALAYLRGLSHGELAEWLREPLGTVKTYVRRGLMQLKACLES
jgi:RNA polymerase sigma-70 factor, ECF subfamily